MQRETKLSSVRKGVRVKILIADDHAVVRRGYTSLLSTIFAPCEVADAGTAEEAIKINRRQCPDIIILDMNIHGVNGVDIAREMLQDQPDAKILMFSMHDELPILEASLAVGAKGYITKRSPPEVLIEAVKKITAGEPYIEDELMERLAGSISEQAQSRIDSMTTREYAIFAALVKGDSSHEIARNLNISTKTVSNYTAILKNKLNIGSTAEFVHYAIQAGVLKFGCNKAVPETLQH